MITAIIRNKENTLVLELPHSIYDIYEKLQSIGIMQPPKQIPLTDNEGEDIGVKLFSESDFGQHLLLTLNEKNTIADANMLTLVIGAASEDIKEELEQNILYDQYDVALPIKVDTKSGFQLAHPGDSIDLAYPTMNTRRGRVGEKIAHTVTPGNTQGYFFIDMNADPQLTETARCITARQDSGISKHKGEHSAVFIEDEPRAVVTPDKKTIRQQGRWIKEPNEPMFTLTVQDRHGILRYGRVRKLTPRECWRLQGFTDEQFDKAKAAGLSDGRLYKMAGNAVSVPVVSAVGAVIKRIYHEQIQKG